MYAKRVDQIKPFRVMEILARAGELEALGHRVVHFEVGEPDFDTAEPIVSAGRQALSDGRTRYTTATGIEPLRDVIAQYYEGIGVALDPGRIVVTAGASGGLALLAGLLLDPGSEVLITDPGYPANEVFVRLVGGSPALMSIGAQQQFRPSLVDVRAAWREQTRGALLASPANPTGAMMTADSIREISAFIAGRDGFFILDEIYQGLVNDPPYASALQIDEDLFVLNSFSKYFGMTGWRLGWVVVPEHAVAGITKLAQNVFISPSSVAQYAAVAAFSDSAVAIHEERAQVFRDRCKQLADGLHDLGFVVPVMPDGAFYLYVDVSHTGLTSGEFCLRLLDDYHVAVTPGEDFGQHHHDRYVRFAYTTSAEDIAIGLERIRNALTHWGCA